MLVVLAGSKHVRGNAAMGVGMAAAAAHLATSSAHSAEEIAHGMEAIPEGFKAYKRTPQFTAENIPKTLLHRHNTKGGSWGKINVSKGSVEYIILGPPERKFTLTPDTPGIIKTMEYHKVKLLDPDTEFHVEFWAENPEEAQAPRHVPTQDLVKPSGDL